MQWSRNLPQRLGRGVQEVETSTEAKVATGRRVQRLFDALEHSSACRLVARAPLQPSMRRACRRERVLCAMLE